MTTIHDLPNEIIHMLAKRLHQTDRWCLSRASGPLFNALYDRKLANITRGKLYDMMICPVTTSIDDILRPCGYIHNRFKTVISELADTVGFVFKRTYTISFAKNDNAEFSAAATMIVTRNMVTCRRSISLLRVCLDVDASQYSQPNGELNMILRRLMDYELRLRSPF